LVQKKPRSFMTSLKNKRPSDTGLLKENFLVNTTRDPAQN
jgi:hypothetical protein